VSKIVIPASKSLSNRWLILQYLFPQIQINHISKAQDTVVLQNAINQIKNSRETLTYINIGHAGTAMRFLTALLASIPNRDFILDGSSRMRQRPIKILVDTLEQLGAKITYLNQKGFPPLLIEGKKLTGNQVNISQNISSQYISALLLIAPTLPQGLQLNLEAGQVSKPYVDMTLSILKSLGVTIEQNANKIHIAPVSEIKNTQTDIEGDWSSASYFYGARAVLNLPEIKLYPFDKISLQGDQKIQEYFSKLGIKSVFENNQLLKLQNIDNFTPPDYISFDLIDTPDLAQTLAVTCLSLGIKCRLTGLQTLRIKETDRLQALQNEMQKLGAKVIITDNSLEITQPTVNQTNISIKTYDDHRMGMSFAILQLKYPEIQIQNPEVVIKSFPDFWEKFRFD